MTGIKLPGLDMYTYVYTDGARLQQVKNPQGVVVGQLDIDNMGRIGAVSVNGQVKAQYGFDVYGELQVYIEDGINQSFFRDHPGGYRDGRLVSKRNNVTGTAENYAYDEVGRLKSAGAQGFSYDGFGNLYEKTGINAENRVGQLDSAKNQLGGTFDAAGNELWHPQVQYDYENRMTQAPRGVTSVEKYGYGADN